MEPAIHATLADARVELTPINGLELHHTKVVGDARGLLAELVQGGAANPVLSHGFGNLYTSIAIGKHTGRAAHLHVKLHEIFCTLTGTALWFFHDFREASPTFGKSHAVVLGFDRPTTAVPDSVYVLSEKDMARCIVPGGVYHAYWPLTDAPVFVVSIASMPHDDADYDRRKPDTVPGCRDWVGKYGIALS
ncbi:MAG: dTDP-4-dehydrorhamnose 3,5-epimerase family protein [bacterium]|nr:dTDP-4-dehydrorhamnose 3,5-epimerase family protein [bacterium]